MLKSVYNLFLYTNSLLMYKVNTVKFWNNLVHDILKSNAISDVPKSQNNKHILLVCFIKKFMLKIFYNLFLHKFMIDV